ncbi:MAG: hypothetical protein GX330_03525 [Bacteroidales bacterium]|nr:hypothetical protein [Bacteroidales bacterium]
MKKSILSLTAVAVLGFFMTSCNPDVLITGTENIVVDLGATDADVLEGVEASNGKEVTVSGIDYDKAGEQTAIFEAGEDIKEDVVKIKTDKLTGEYECTIGSDLFDSKVTQSATVFNKILIDGYLESGKLEAICNGDVITLDEINLVDEDDVKGTLTGEGTFEKEGDVYQVKSITVVITWEDGEETTDEVNFKKL